MTSEIEKQPDALPSIDRVELVRQLFEIFLERYGSGFMMEMLMQHVGDGECGYAVTEILYPREKQPSQKQAA